MNFTEEQRTNIETWITALQSGDYAQTVGVLNRKVRGVRNQAVGYCCLGVSCEIRDEVSKQIRPHEEVANTVYTWPVEVCGGAHQYDTLTVPPDWFMEVYGLSEEAMEELVDANDKHYDLADPFGAAIRTLQDYISTDLA